MAQYRSPQPLNFMELKWDTWRSTFMTFRLVTKLHKETGEIQVASLKYCMGAESEDVFKTFGLNGEQEKDFDAVIKKFDDYFKPKVNVIRLRRIFQRRIQELHENEETYLRALYVSARDCEFGDLMRERIRDQFIAGIRDEKLAEKLEHSYLCNRERFTLEFVTEYTRSYCDVVEGRRMEKTENIQSVKSQGNGKFRNTNKNHQIFNSCGYCGSQHIKGKCPAYGKICAKCGKKNHFQKVCRGDVSAGNHSVHMREVAAYEEIQSSDEDIAFLGECFVGNKARWTISANLGKTEVSFKIDTGADVSVINYASFMKLSHKPNLLAPDKRLITPTGKIELAGMIDCVTKCNGISSYERFYVMTCGNTTCNLLSRIASEKFALVKFVGGINVKDELFGFGLWKTVPVDFHLKDNVRPFSVNTARNIAIPLFEQVKEAINEMVLKGIIEPVTEPTDWVSPMVPVVKSGTGKRKVRICVDFRKLNIGLKREKYNIPTFDELSHRLANARVMSKLDAASGFFQIPLSESARNFTTFLTPFGRYRFKRLPMGVSVAPEIDQRKMTELLSGVEGVLIYMDDVLVFGDTAESHNKILKRVLDRIEISGLRLNKEKCIFCTDKLEFLGHSISTRGISVCPRRIDAIRNMKPPSNVKELQRLLGMINFVTKFIVHAQTILRPLNELLQKNAAWNWDHPQSKAFEKIKEMICNSPVLAYFDPKKTTIVSADASSYGIGGVLLQKHGEQLKPVAFCSRTLTDAEKNYAQIERELLAGVWACERFYTYLCGLEFELQTDHKPLVPLINSKSLPDAPIRCQRLLMRLARYTPVAIYVPGKLMVVADTLSRNLNVNSSKKSELLRKEVDLFVVEELRNVPASSQMVDKISKQQMNDPVLRKVVHYTLNGWNEEFKEYPELNDYHAARGDLSVVNGSLLVYRNRLVIPACERKIILNRIHDGHLSLQKCRKRAQSSVWWPRLSQDLSVFIERCSFCQVYRRKNKSEPMKCSVLPERPWMKLGIDLFELEGRTYLVVVDYFSRWIEVKFLKRTDSETTIFKLNEIFACFGIPECLISDGGPQFSSKLFMMFSKDYDFVHKISDPHYPQGNGCAERAVKVAKRLFRSPDPTLALMAYRNTPLEVTGYSPARLLMGRNTRTLLPMLPSQLNPQWPNMEDVQKRDAIAKEKTVNNFNKLHGARRLPELHEGQMVRVKLPHNKSWSEPVELQSRLGQRSYVVRNRKFLQPVPEPQFQGAGDGVGQAVRDSELSRGPGGPSEATEIQPSCSNNDVCESDEGSPGLPVGPPSNNDRGSAGRPGHSAVITRYGRISKPVEKYSAM